MPIDHEDARPLNVQIAEDLRRRIAEHEFAPGQRFPSLRTLASEYDVAELTVHNAVRELQRDRLLISTSGRGTFVSDPEKQAADDPVLADLLAVRAELQDLRDTVAKYEQSAAVDERLQALTERVAALERGRERPAEQ